MTFPVWPPPRLSIRRTRNQEEAYFEFWEPVVARAERYFPGWEVCAYDPDLVLFKTGQTYNEIQYFTLPLAALEALEGVVDGT